MIVHLDKRFKRAPTKKELKTLKDPGRVKDLAFTKNNSAWDIGRLLLSSFNSLSGVDLPLTSTSCILFSRGAEIFALDFITLKIALLEGRGIIDGILQTAQVAQALFTMGYLCGQ